MSNESHLPYVASELAAWVAKHWTWLSASAVGLFMAVKWSWNKYMRSEYVTITDLQQHEERESQHLEDHKQQIMEYLDDITTRNETEHTKFGDGLVRIHERLDHIHDLLIERAHRK